MTVKELIKALEKLDYNRIVLLQVNAQDYVLYDIEKYGKNYVLLLPPTYHDDGDRVEHWYNEGDMTYNVR